ncbi:MAG TPA: hypothetical protein VJ941_12025 [Gracilimonas sp.]|nr:hypothetical protein [Gracilimonas sp.]
MPLKRFGFFIELHFEWISVNHLVTITSRSRVPEQGQAATYRTYGVRGDWGTWWL